MITFIRVWRKLIGYVSNDRSTSKLEKFLESRDSASFNEIFIMKALGERRPPTSESGTESGVPKRMTFKI